VNAWKNEMNTIPLSTVKKLANKSGIAVPTVLEKDLLLHLQNIGFLGAHARFQKHGSLKKYDENRKRRWKIWWEEEGKHLPNVITKPKEIHMPKLTAELAEFTGIMIGDGTVAPYHIAVTLNSHTDAEYAQWVSNLLNTLFCVPVQRYDKKGVLATNVVVQRKA
jgi:hypothetical protein